MDLEDIRQNRSVASAGWFCLRSQPKREHMAAGHLRRIEGVEVFNPRMRIKKATRRGVVTFVEAVFPNYIFARFDIQTLLYTVKYTPNVSTVIHFGDRIPMIPDWVIEDLRAHFGEEELHEVEEHVEEGDDVVIGEGPFMGMRGKVLRVLTPYQRVEVLLEMLGRVTPVIVRPECLVAERSAAEMLGFSN